MGTAPDRDYCPPKVSVIWADVLAAILFGFALVGIPLLVLGLA